MVKSDQVNGVKPFQVRTTRARKDEADLRSTATPRMPHERDESEDSQASDVRDDIKLAYDNVMEGQLDTDLREGRGVEETVTRPSDKNVDSPQQVPYSSAVRNPNDKTK